jgi:hypothetical protein
MGTREPAWVAFSELGYRISCDLERARSIPRRERKEDRIETPDEIRSPERHDAEKERGKKIRREREEERRGKREKRREERREKRGERREKGKEGKGNEETGEAEGDGREVDEPGPTWIWERPETAAETGTGELGCSAVGSRLGLILTVV